MQNNEKNYERAESEERKKNKKKTTNKKKSYSIGKKNLVVRDHPIMKSAK